jgi:hypothetical protein
MSGVRALDIRSLVQLSERDHPEALLGSAGELTEEGTRVRELISLLDAIDDPGLKRRADCLLLVNRENARLREACSVCGSLPTGLAAAPTLGLLRVIPRMPEGGDQAELDHDASFDAFFDGLRRAGIKLGIADTSISNAALQAARVILIPSFSRMSRSLAQRLFEWAGAGRTLVLGPRLPERDWAGGALGFRLPIHSQKRLPSLPFRNIQLQEVDIFAGGEPVIESDEGPLAVLVPYGEGRIVRFGFRLPFNAARQGPDAVAWILEQLVGAAGATPCYAASDPCVETELHESSVRRFLFIANPTSVDRPVTLGLGPNESLREVRGRAEHVRAGQPLVVPAAAVLLRELVQL